MRKRAATVINAVNIDPLTREDDLKRYALYLAVKFWAQTDGIDANDIVETAEKFEVFLQAK